MMYTQGLANDADKQKLLANFQTKTQNELLRRQQQQIEKQKQENEHLKGKIDAYKKLIEEINHPIE